MFGRRRLTLIGTTVGALLLLTAACSGGDPQAGPTPTPTPTGPVLLTFAVYGPPQVVTAYTKIAADFTAAHPDTVVNIKPYDTHEAEMTALDQQLAAGDPPDAFLADLTDVPKLVHDKSVERLDELLGERHVDFGDGFQRDALEAFSAENALQCMPVDISPLVVYYNTDLVDLTAFPKPVTADTGWKLDIFAAAATAASGGQVRGIYVNPDLDQVAPFVWSGGGEITDDQNAPLSLSLASSASAKALEKLLEIVRDPQITFSAQQLARKSALARFKSGTLAMMLGYRDLTPVLRAQQGLNFDVMPLPKIGTKATSAQSSGLCLAKVSKHPEQTADFLAYAVSTDAMTQLASTGYVVPTNLDVVNSDAFLQPTELPASSRVFATAVRSIRRFPAVMTWPSVETSSESLLHGLFYDAVIDPLNDRLKAIDAASVPLFTPLPPTPSATPTPTTGATSPSSTPSG